jgi:WD40 repeat protein
MSTLTSKEHKALNGDAPEECDRTPAIPTNIIFDLILPIFDLILPFVQDRRTWNSVCSATKELYAAGMGMTPPWPETKFNLGQKTGSLKFSPCGSFLACGSRTAPYRVYICDRRGRITRLTGHTSCVSHLSFSKDGKFLVSAGNQDRSIRIWSTNFTGLPEQSRKSLQGQRRAIECFAFAPDDSNVFVAAGFNEIKVWNVETEVCTHNLYHRGGSIRSMFFPAGGIDRTCNFVTSEGSLIRTCWNELSGTTASDIVNMLGMGQILKSTFSPCGSLLAVLSHDQYLSGRVQVDVTLFDMKAMSVVQSLTLDDREYTPRVFISDALAFSPNGKTIVCHFGRSEILVLQVHDLNIRHDMNIRRRHDPCGNISVVAFDPSSQCVASGATSDNYVRLWTF